MLHKTAEPVQTSRLGVFTVSKSFTMKVSASFSSASAVFLPKMRGLKVSGASVTVVCIIYSIQLFIEQQLKYKERTSSSLGTSVLTKASPSSWYAQYLFLGCQSWYTSQNKAEEEGE